MRTEQHARSCEKLSGSAVNEITWSLVIGRRARDCTADADQTGHREEYDVELQNSGSKTKRVILGHVSEQSRFIRQQRSAKYIRSF